MHMDQNPMRSASEGYPQPQQPPQQAACRQSASDALRMRANAARQQAKQFLIDADHYEDLARVIDNNLPRESGVEYLLWRLVTEPRPPFGYG